MGRLSLPGTIERPLEDSTSTNSAGGYLVVVFNNDHNTYDEVMMILMIATECDADEAYIETWEIDHLGKSVVHRSNEQECRRIAGVISTIGITVEVLAEA